MDAEKTQRDIDCLKAAEGLDDRNYLLCREMLRIGIERGALEHGGKFPLRSTYVNDIVNAYLPERGYQK